MTRRYVVHFYLEVENESPLFVEDSRIPGAHVPLPCDVFVRVRVYKKYMVGQEFKGPNSGGSHLDQLVWPSSSSNFSAAWMARCQFFPRSKAHRACGKQTGAKLGLCGVLYCLRLAGSFGG